MNEKGCCCQARGRKKKKKKVKRQRCLPDLDRHLIRFPSTFLPKHFLHLFSTTRTGEVGPHRFQITPDAHLPPTLAAWCPGAPRLVRFHGSRRQDRQVQRLPCLVGDFWLMRRRLWTPCRRRSAARSLDPARHRLGRGGGRGESSPASVPVSFASVEAPARDSGEHLLGLTREGCCGG